MVCSCGATSADSSGYSSGEVAGPLFVGHPECAEVPSNTYTPSMLGGAISCTQGLPANIVAMFEIENTFLLPSLDELGGRGLGLWPAVSRLR